jgi:peptidoglycan/LPS O-acetylase OafA/YrhL
LLFITTGREYDQERYAIDAFFANLFLVNSWGLIPTLSWNIPSWSISVEFLAYLLFPFFLLTVLKIKSLAGYIIAAISVILILASSFFYLGLDSIGQGLPFSGVIRCSLEFLLGVYIWNIFSYLFNSKQNKNEVAVVLLLILLILLFVGIYFQLPDYTSIAAISASLILFCAYIEAKFNFKVPKFWRWLGDISFSVYMLHYLLRDIMKLFLNEGSTPFVWIVLYFALLLLFSHICFKYVEIKSQKLVLMALLPTKKSIA